MELIDEEGRLFGRVNVVDALVVLVLLAVVAAGVALVTGGGGGPAGPGGDGSGTGTRYATVAFGPQPTWLASAMQAGENVALAGSTATVNVTDVYLTDARGGQVDVVARLAYPDGTTVGKSPIRAGRSVTVVGDDYQAKAAVQAVGNGSSLQRGTTAVSMTTTVDPATAAAVEVGDRFTVGAQPLATVESVTSLPVNETRRRLRLGVTLATRTVADEPQFAGQSLRIGSRIPLRTNAVAGLNGTVHAVGSLEPSGEPTTVTTTVTLEDVRPTLATALSAGMTESHRGATARIVDVASEPATRVVANDSGDLRVSDHPRNRDVTLTVRATAREGDSGIRFHDRPLTLGRTVTLEFETVTVRGTVLGFESDD